MMLAALFTVCDLFGLSVVNLGDLNGNGIPEIAISDPVDADSLPMGAGRVWIVSLRDAAVHAEFAGLRSGENFGEVLCVPGDLDGDGYPDLLISSGSEGECSVLAVSARRGEELFRVAVEGGPGRGLSLASAGDWNSDGTPDFLIGQPFARHGAGAVSVISGGDGEQLASFAGVFPGGGFGYTVTNLGDVNRDGTNDILVTKQPHSGHGVDSLREIPRVGAIESCEVLIISGRTGTTLRTHRPDGYSRSFGTALAGNVDLNGDGVGDYLISEPYRNAESRVVAYSGNSGQSLLTWKARGASTFGENILAYKDLDGDGVNDVVIASPEGPSRGGGSLWVLSGNEDRPLRHLHANNMDEAMFGTALDLTADLDGDNVPEIVVGSASWKAWSSFKGVVRVISAQTGKTLVEIRRQDLEPASGK